MAITAGEEGHSEATNTTAANQLGVGGKGRNTGRRPTAPTPGEHTLTPTTRLRDSATATRQSTTAKSCAHDAAKHESLLSLQTAATGRGSAQVRDELRAGQACPAHSASRTRRCCIHLPIVADFSGVLRPVWSCAGRRCGRQRFVRSAVRWPALPTTQYRRARYAAMAAYVTCMDPLAVAQLARGGSGRALLGVGCVGVRWRFCGLQHATVPPGRALQASPAGEPIARRALLRWACAPVRWLSATTLAA
jgi:hypothetical protein